MAKQKKLGRKFSLSNVIISFLLCLWGLIILYPFYNAVLMSIVPYGVYVKEPFLLYPPALDFSSYKFILSWRQLPYGFKTTLIVLVIGTVYSLFLTVTMAYVMSRRIPGRKLINLFVVFTMFFQGGLIPGYLLIKNLGLMNSYFAMILPYGISVFNLMIMRSYFYTIPEELNEAAKLDGAGELRILFKIYLPLAVPMLATIGLYYGVDRWNEWYNGMLYIREIEKQPLQLMIKNMLDATQMVVNAIPVDARPTAFPGGIQMAGIIIAMLPIALVYPFLQKYFVKGLTLGGVKA